MTLLEEGSAEGGSASAGRRRGPRKGMSVFMYVDLEVLALSPSQAVRPSVRSVYRVGVVRSLPEPRSGFTNSLVLP